MLFLQIQLGPHDYVREVSGTQGPFGPAANVITSLNIITNLTSFSFGRARGTNFRIPVENNGRIVGFYGRSGWYLDAIGVYIRA
ncbi:hypothetical protein PR202_gb08056 [Eleusine coracana subsp. coracana]|uniref:Jacalin-type lectin domain-containing protein n=1 Tax=Eleusine coracana subsp. coracana TaxID=191504 RepID=A0AAV5EES9_ELECO|nr:hypothetical protein PR202_ga00266 [Eleusine coracana subsp. coracana]GJN20656.1 hypothetical protein PR202_gb08056 [Eleusine coracana subsp. coracana]